MKCFNLKINIVKWQREQPYATFKRQTLNTKHRKIESKG